MADSLWCCGVKRQEQKALWNVTNIGTNSPVFNFERHRTNKHTKFK